MDDADLNNFDIVPGNADSDSSAAPGHRASGSGKRQCGVRRRVAGWLC